MRFRTGLVVGFAAGFYVGSWAGRERYQQINETLSRVRQSDTFDTATGKAKAVVDLGKERAKDIVDARRGREAGTTDTGSTEAGSTEAGSTDVDTAPLVPTPDGDGPS
jgi:hypothetical protein